MAGPIARTTAPAGRAHSLAQTYRRFGATAAGTSPLYERVAIALSESGDALRALEAVPVRQRHPALILAALHDLVLAGRAPELAAAYAAAVGGDGVAGGEATGGDDLADGGEVAGGDEIASSDVTVGGAAGGGGVGRDVARDDAAAAVAAGTLVRMNDAVAAIAGRRAVLADQGGHYAVLYPAIAEAAHRAGADAVGLIDVGRAAGFNLNVDRVRVSYSNGQSLGGPSALAQSGPLPAVPLPAVPLPSGPLPVVPLTVVSMRGSAVPERVIPRVVSRAVVAADPVDVTDPDEARWLRACVGPDQREQVARLDAELALAAADPPLLLAGDVTETLPEALARVPDGALPVVVTTWALSALSLEDRLRFLQRLDAAATHRPVAWVPVEGVGVAPGVPTFGDRRASGHSVVGVAVFGHATLHAEAVGRCWSQGRYLAWLAGS